MSGTIKAGLIGLVVGALLGLGGTLLLPCCTPCVAIAVGLGVGFLACWWERPPSSSQGAGLGARAGAIAGAGHLIGQVGGALINGFLVSPERATETAAELLERLGWTEVAMPAMSARTYWLWQILINGSCGLANIAIAAGLGALGGLLWYQTVAQRQAGL